MGKNDTDIPLIDAAISLSLSRERTLRLVLAGKLEGEQYCGRWIVSSSSVARFKRERSEQTLAAVAN